MKNPFLIALVSALVTAAAMFAVPAFAEPSASNVSLVRTGDLDLGSSAGRSRLEHRLAIAAREVCGTASDADVAGKNDVRRCRDETLAQARTQRDELLAANGIGRAIAVTAAR